ncbi:MAG: GNAT family N-acetyltransferase [Polyangiales bacterium]
MTVEVVTSIERLASLAPDYARLEKVAHATLPFTTLEWHLAWWNQFSSATAAMRSSLRVQVVRASSGDCLAIVPFVLEQRPGRGPLKLQMLSFIGRDPWITELRMPLVDPAHAERAGKATRRALDEDPDWDWIYWSGLDRVAAFGDALCLGRHIVTGEPLHDYVVELRPTWEAFRASLKRNIRESLRHCYNSLKRDGHTFELEVATTPADVRRACRTLLDLHVRRSEVTGTVAHANHFESKRAQQFLFEVAERSAARGSTHVFSLVIRGEVVASRIGFVVGDSLYLYYSGYDPRWSRYGVMTTTMAEAIKFAIERKLATVNLSVGTDVSKTRWGPRCEEYAEVIEPRDSIRARAGLAAYRTATRPPSFVGKILRHFFERRWS